MTFVQVRFNLQVRALCDLNLSSHVDLISAFISSLQYSKILIGIMNTRLLIEQPNF